MRQFDLPEGTKVTMFNKDTRNYVMITFRGMEGAYGKWEVAGHILKGNYYGTFHLNKSQKYYYYKPDEEE